MMERLFSAPAVVAFWAGLNTLMAALLAGFVAAGSGGSMIVVAIYASSAGLVFLIALATWLARRRRRQPPRRGLSVPPRPATTLMLAVAFTLLWLGLPFGEWVPITAALPLATAGLMELYARRGIRKLPPPAPPRHPHQQSHQEDPAGLLTPLRLMPVRLLAVRLLAVE